MPVIQFFYCFQQTIIDEGSKGEPLDLRFRSRKCTALLFGFKRPVDC